jgi:hypothetical protein
MFVSYITFVVRLRALLHRGYNLRRSSRAVPRQPDTFTPTNFEEASARFWGNVRHEFSLRQHRQHGLRCVSLRGGPGCLNRFSASISGASARVRLPSGVAAG